MPFQTPIDIANRACQHMGARQIDTTLGFTETSVQSAEISACLDKLRRAELQANLWTFSTRRAILRMVDTTTFVLKPTLWSSSITYFNGSIVADQDGVPWISRIRSNLGNDPV